MKECPNYGSKKMDESNIRPDCGYQLTAEGQQTKEIIEEINADETMQDRLTGNVVFPDTGSNDPVERSELKDLPLESAMELFGKTEPEDDVPSTHDKVADREKMEQRKVTVRETLERSGKDQEETLESKQKERVAELKETTKNEEENPVLSAYVEIHHEDAKEEHAEELLEMTSGKTA